MGRTIGVFIMLLLVGCNHQKVNLNFLELEQNLNLLSYKDNDNQIKPLFNNEIVSGDELKNRYGFDMSNVNEILFSVPINIEDASMYIIVLPKNNKENEVKMEVATFFNKYEQEWNQYFPKEEYLVKNRLETKHGGYLIYIVSNDNNKVSDKIKENK